LICWSYFFQYFSKASNKYEKYDNLKMVITSVKIKLSKIKHIKQIAINALLLSSITDQLIALLKLTK